MTSGHDSSIKNLHTQRTLTVPPTSGSTMATRATTVRQNAPTETRADNNGESPPSVQMATSLLSSVASFSPCAFAGRALAPAASPCLSSSSASSSPSPRPPPPPPFTASSATALLAVAVVVAVGFSFAAFFPAVDGTVGGEGSSTMFVDPEKSIAKLTPRRSARALSTYLALRMPKWVGLSTHGRAGRHEERICC